MLSNQLKVRCTVFSCPECFSGGRPNSEDACKAHPPASGRIKRHCLGLSSESRLRNSHLGNIRARPLALRLPLPRLIVAYLSNFRSVGCWFLSSSSLVNTTYSDPHSNHNAHILLTLLLHSHPSQARSLTAPPILTCGIP
jgi:hypothetical protein